MKHKILSIIIAVIIIFSLSIGTYADSDPLPAPDWVSISTNSDGSKTVAISTPSYMLDAVSYYEYSTDSKLTWEKLNDNTGGEFVFDTTTEFALRYISSGFYSGIYEFTVEITKYSVITSSAGVSLLVPYESQLPQGISLFSYEIISGTDYTAISEYFGENKSFILTEVFIIHNNDVYNNTLSNEWLFPAGDLDVRYCKLYHIDDRGVITEIESLREMNVLHCTTDKTGLFAVVEDKTYSKGDVNGDAVVSAADARLALRYSAQLEVFLPVQLDAADVDNNDTVTASDARTILRVSASLESI